MRIVKLHKRAAAILALGAAMSFSGVASAVVMQTFLAPIYQVGTGPTVNLGHTVYASTDYNRLYAGGTYSAICAGPDILPTVGQRFLSTENIAGRLTLYVTIPERHPARVHMPGFSSAAARGQRMNCTYNWTSRAIESGYSIGVGGISFQTGNGERSEGGTEVFTMGLPSLGDEDEWTSCHP